MRVNFQQVMTETIYDCAYSNSCIGSYILVPASHIEYLRYEAQSPNTRFNNDTYFLHDTDCNLFVELWQRELQSCIMFNHREDQIDVSGFKSVAIIKPKNNTQKSYNDIPYDIRKAITKYLFLQDNYKTGTKELPTVQNIVSDFNLNFIRKEN
jgi:hypothetical protein